MALRRKLPPLNALKAFESAARLGGFTAAGEELFVSPGAVSRHVANLEAFLGISLFKRSHNEVHLTPEGASYLAKIRGAMDAIAQASSSVIAESTPQKLHIHALPTFTERWLMPLLPRFIELHPRVQIQLSTSLEETDWDTDGADISIYASIGAWLERGDRLFDTEIVPVCSPDWFARNGKPATPQELVGQPLISSINKDGDWLRWFHAAGLQPQRAVPGYIFGTSALAYKAAIDGLGLVCAEHRFISEDLAAGRLMLVTDIRTQGSSYFLELPPDKRQNSLSTSFRTWLLAQALSQGDAEVRA